MLSRAFLVPRSLTTSASTTSALCTRRLCASSTSTSTHFLTSASIRGLRTLTRPQQQQPYLFHTSRRSASHTPPLVRWASSKSVADEKIEEITELYATARDEFEIAAEETENNTVYAEEDRAAARQELERVQEAYKAVLEGPDKDVADEVKRRIGQRIRELENAVVAMEEMAMNQD
ncbi:hypothetical protein AAFC00_002416 [Neodothiora populina]|uniref:Uncharacterized protein n=1 Tax=Neodothiora populina TaxID=2781224 RepID=A0ABR3P8D3_9PEZI